MLAERMLLIEESLISFPPVTTIRLNFGLSNYSFTVVSLCCIWCLRACLTDWQLSYLTVKVTSFTPVRVCAFVSGPEAVPGDCVSTEVDILMDQSPSDCGDLRLGNVSIGSNCK